MARRIIGIHEKLPILESLPLSFQHLTAMFGATIWIIRGAALLAIAFSCIGKVSAAISTIPAPVMGGITMLLYGVIAVQGFRMFVEQKVDFSKNSNMVLGAITFVVGVSGASVNIGTVQLKGMAFAAIVGVILSLLFWTFGKLGLMNKDV